jgi:hypothetical protein
MLLYFTYHDQPSGVYWSQVTDVVAYLKSTGHPRVRLVALVSGRDFWRTHKAIRAHCPGAWVLPMVPTMLRWRMNVAWLFFVCLWSRPAGILCRGPFAASMALRMRKWGLTRKVGFDGRGAYAAEWREYRLLDNDSFIQQVPALEHQAVEQSDFRIAVSQALVRHWQKQYAYASEEHVVVPCTLGLEHGTRASALSPTWRAHQGISPHAVLLCYSGSTAGWQSFPALVGRLRIALGAQTQLHVLFLSKQHPAVSVLAAEYPGRVHCQWLPTHSVAAVLREVDFGILLREDTVTNRVASPTKFAEYLSAGAGVLISPELGDLSALVANEDLGLVVNEGDLPTLSPRTEVQRAHCEQYAQAHFTKEAHHTAYMRVWSVLGN